VTYDICEKEENDIFNELYHSNINTTLFIKIGYSSSFHNYNNCQRLIQSLLNFFHLLARKPNLEKKSIYLNKFFHNFHLSQSSGKWVSVETVNRYL